MDSLEVLDERPIGHKRVDLHPIVTQVLHSILTHPFERQYASGGGYLPRSGLLSGLS